MLKASDQEQLRYIKQNNESQTSSLLTTILNNAIKNGSVVRLDILFDPNYTLACLDRPDVRNLLHFAVEQNDLFTIKQLVRNTTYHYCLIVAVQVKKLALHVAIEMGKTEIARYILKNDKIGIGFTDNFKNNCAHLAILHNNLEIVGMIIQYAKVFVKRKIVRAMLRLS